MTASGHLVYPKIHGRLKEGRAFEAQLVRNEQSLSKVFGGSVLTASMSSDVPLNAVKKKESCQLPPYPQTHSLVQSGDTHSWS